MEGPTPGERRPRWDYNEEIVVLNARFRPRSGSLFRIIHFFRVESRASMAYVQTAHPKNNVLCDIRSVIRDALQISRRQHELQMWCRVRRLLDHSRKHVLKYLVSIAVHHIV